VDNKPGQKEKDIFANTTKREPNNLEFPMITEPNTSKSNGIPEVKKGLSGSGEDFLLTSGFKDPLRAKGSPP